MTQANNNPAAAPAFVEEVELQGHIIDSLLLPKVLDAILTRGAGYEIKEFRVGKRQDDPSHVRIEVRVAQDVANYLLNKKRRDIARLEEGGDIQVQVQGVIGAPPELLEFLCFDHNNNEVKFLAAEPAPAGRSRR